MGADTDAAVGDRDVNALIVGCGYLGTVTAGLLTNAGRKVYATTRSRARRVELEESGVPCREFDVAQPAPGLALPREWHDGALDVFLMLTPSALAPALGAGGGFGRLLRDLAALQPRRAVLVSSTGVYGGTSGEVVSAESPVLATGEREARLLDIERRWRETDDRFGVCRLAGIYGPDRIIGRRPLLDGKAIPGDAEAWLNLIHVADAARLVIACAASGRAAAVELGSDGAAVRRQEYYSYLARLLDVSPPQFDPSRPARSASKRCDPGSTMTRLGWSPVHAGFRSGLAASLAAGAAQGVPGYGADG